MFDRELEEPILEEEVIEEIEGFSGADQDMLRRDLLRNLYVFTKAVCQYRDINPATHGAFLQFIENHPKNRRLGLMPRTHLKSTGATIADSLRRGLNDPDDFRGLIVGETDTTASLFHKEVRGHIEKNKIVQALWPDLIPRRFSGPGVTWSNSAASLERNTGHREATWTSIGVGGAVVGSHFNYIKCDDLIGFEAYRSPAAMANAIKWVDNIEPLMIDQHHNIIDWIGTRWAVNDLYSHLMNQYGADLGVFTRGAIEDGEIIFPAKHTWAEYNRLMTRTPLVWHSQYENNPLASGGTDFNTGKVGNFTFSLDGLRVEFYDQLTGQPKSWPINQLDIVQTCDPNSGSKLAPDTAAICVTGVSPDYEVFVLFSWSDRPTPSDYVDKIFNVAKRWRPRVVGIEKAGQQTAKHYFEKKLTEELVSFATEDLKPENKNKELRIRDNLEPVINSGQLYLLGGHTILRKQIGDFPQNARYDNALIDELDALAYAPMLWRKPMKIEDQKERVSKLRLLLRRRSSVTGY